MSQIFENMIAYISTILSAAIDQIEEKLSYGFTTFFHHFAPCSQHLPWNTSPSTWRFPSLSYPPIPSRQRPPCFSAGAIKTATKRLRIISAMIQRMARSTKVLIPRKGPSSLRSFSVALREKIVSYFL